MASPEPQDSINDDRSWLARFGPVGGSEVDGDREVDFPEIVGIPGTLLQVFTYSTEAITHCGGLDDLAHRLLLDVQRLRARQESDWPIAFVSHDYGGTIVKRALVMASRTESFGNLLLFTWGLVFLGCPQRCDRARDLEDKFTKLLLLEAKSKTHHVAGVTRLASVMAETTRATNEEFISANLLARFLLLAIYSTHKDDSLRIFDKADVCFLVPSEARWPTKLSHQELSEIKLYHGFPLGVKNAAKREALVRLSSPVYPPSTRTPDRLQLGRLGSQLSFQDFQQMRAGISVLEVFGHGDVRTAAEYILNNLEPADELRSDETPNAPRNFLQFFQFNSHDARFKNIGCMLRTAIAQVAKLISRPSTTNAFHNHMAELAENSTVWADGEMYDLWLYLVGVIDGPAVWLVLACFDECDARSRNWFLSRLSSSIVATELSLKLIITHNRTDKGDELRMALSRLGQGAVSPETHPILYTLDLDKLDFTASTSQYERPPAPLAARDPERYPQTAELFSRVADMPEVHDALAPWIELNRKGTEQMAATLQQQLPPLSFTSVCRAILDAVPEPKQRWAREVMTWLALSFRPLTIEEAAAAVGLGISNNNRPCSGRDFVAALRKNFGGLLYIVHGEVRGGPKLWQAVKSGAARGPSAQVPWYEFLAEDSHDGHWEIAKKCLQYLSSRGMQHALEKLSSTGRIWAEDAAQNDEIELPDRRLLAYTTANWPLHYQESNSYQESSSSPDRFTASDSPDLDDDVVDFLDNDMLREPWARAYYRTVTHRPAENAASETFPPLRVCGQVGFGHLLRHFGGGSGKQAWQQAAMEAAAHNQIDTLRLIFATEPTAADGLDPDKAIRAAMSSSNEEVILEVLDKLPAKADGAAPAWASDLLLQSSRLGFTAVVRELLGPPWNASHSSAGAGALQPLHYAARGDHIEIAKLLHGAGADMEGTVADDLNPRPSPLIIACEYASPQVAKFLVERGARTDITAGDKDRTPLQFAAASGCFPAVESILSYDNLDRYDCNGEHPVALAINRGYWRGAEIDKKTADRETPAYRAAHRSHAETLELLLQRGADPEGKTTESDGLRPIHIAYDSAEATMVLLRHGAECNRTSRWGTPLLMAAMYGYPDTVRVLLDDGIDGRRERCDLEAENGSGATALTTAVYEGNENIALALLDAGADVNRAMGAHYTAGGEKIRPLHVAVQRGSEALVDKMLQCRADVNARDATGDTPLHRVTSSTSVKVARALLCAGADTESANDNGYTPVWNALQAGNAAIVRLLLGPRGRAKVNLISGGHYSDGTTGRTGLLRWACIHAAPDLVEAVVRLGGADVNVDIPGLYGTPLQSVCHRLAGASAQSSGPCTTGDATIAADDITPLAAEMIRLITLLLEKGAELNPSVPSKGALGYAVNAACLGAPFGVVRFLIRDRGARVDVCDTPARRTPLHLACYRDIRFVDAVLSGHTTHTRTGEKAGTARLEDDAAAVTKLLSTSKDITGRLPLHYAAASGKPDLVRHVLEKLGIAKPGATATATGTAAAGASNLRSIINSPDARGWTPLYWAARAAPIWPNNFDSDDSQGDKNHAAVLRLLINHGADPRAATAQGPSTRRQPHQVWTPLDVAHYHDAPQDVLDALDALAVPANTGDGKRGLVRRRTSNLKSEKKRHGSYCDCCFLAVVGAAYMCIECEDYCLCFTCHGFHAVLHPPPHGVFIDVGVDDDSDDDEDKEEGVQEEEVGPLSDGTGLRHGSEDGAMNEGGSSSAG
ncbi:ankyrin repeat-containing domain protein [Chaetomium tenue]|uniref:Ankyrin repeat-containing domain protein n=1 Tax=Chaetomium tenue TaxID=1854479 RepID=A0ACB7PBS8_9PEZI|nr:ankyrin repeat-containing domain protein [Chaetomium globosum]